MMRFGSKTISFQQEIAEQTLLHISGEILIIYFQWNVMAKDLMSQIFVKILNLTVSTVNN